MCKRAENRNLKRNLEVINDINLVIFTSNQPQ